MIKPRTQTNIFLVSDLHIIISWYHNRENHSVYPAENKKKKTLLSFEDEIAG